MITKHTTTFEEYTITIELVDTRKGYAYVGWFNRDDIDEHFYVSEKTFKRKPTRAQIERLAKEMAHELGGAIKGLIACIPEAKIEEENL